MTISFKHGVVATAADSRDGKISSDAWNQSHVLKGAVGTVLGFDNMGDAIELGLSLSPEQYGAAGDGSTTDDAAFALLSAALNAQGGGSIELRPGATYIVGGQTLSAGHQSDAAGYSFPPNVGFPIDLNGCTKGVVVRLNGATIKCRDGALFGTFNDDQTDKGTTGPYYLGGLATPYHAMIRATACSGGVCIENGELDGNIAAASIGGEYGDTGRQIQMVGIMLDANTCPVVISNVNAHHHGQDGIELVWAGCDEGDPRYPVTLINCDFISNGRQGMSWVGGKAVTAINCRFNDTGKDIGSMPYSSPGAGIDIEAEAAICREGHFINCEFSNNTGSGVLSVGDTAEMVFDHCKLIGTTNWSVYGSGPSYRFNDCTIIGSGVNPYPNAEKSLATQFHQCRFLYGTARSPTGVVYTNNGYMIDAGGLGSQNILFDECQFDTEGNTGIILGYTADALAIYRNCEFIQDGTATGYPRGKFFGNNKFTSGGLVDLSFSTNYGGIQINGVEETGLPTQNPANMQVAYQPGSGNDAALDVGPVADPGYTHTTSLNVRSWGSVRPAAVNFYNGANFIGGISCDPNQANVNFFPHHTNGVFQFFNHDRTVINVSFGDSGNVALVGFVNAGQGYYSTGTGGFIGPFASTAYQGWASPTYGGVVSGFGSTNDATITNRAGTAVLGVTANTVNMTAAGNFAAVGAVSGASVAVGGGTALTKAVVYTPSLTPSSVAAATVAEQTYTVSGLTTADKVIVNPPSIANATGIAGARVSAADTLAIRWTNPTAGSLTPSSGTYTVLAFRS